MRRLALALAAIVPIFATTAPASAAENPTPTEHVYMTADQGCYAKPDAGNFSKVSSLKPVVGSLYAATRATYRGRAIGGGEETFRWIEASTGKGCYVPESWTSTAVDPTSLDPAEFVQSAIVAPPAAGVGVSAIFSGGALVLRSAPTHLSTDLGEAEKGQVLTTTDVVVSEAGSLTGERDWRPVSVDGVLAWINATSLADVPTVDPASLTSSITPSHNASVWSLPGAGEEIGTLTAGDTVPVGTSATSGWLPVEVDGEVGWVLQTDLLATDETEETEPTETETPGVPTDPETKDRIAERIEEWKNRHGESEPTAENERSSPSWWDAAKARVTGENPVAEAIARGRLITAGLIALLALALAVVAHAGTMWLRFGTGPVERLAKNLVEWGIGPVLTVVVHLPLPAAVACGVWAGYVAPTGYFAWLVVVGTATLGGLLAWVTAHRGAAMRDVPGEGLLVQMKTDSTWVLLAAGGACATARIVAAMPWSAAALLGLVFAGAVVSRRLPHTSEQRTDQPDTKEPDAEVMTRHGSTTTHDSLTTEV